MPRGYYSISFQVKFCDQSPVIGENWIFGLNEKQNCVAKENRGHKPWGLWKTSYYILDIEWIKNKYIGQQK